MSTNKLSHLKEGEKIYLELSRRNVWGDDDDSYWMEDKNGDGLFVDDDSIFYFPNDLKQLANDGIPKQGEMIEAKCEFGEWRKTKFICFLNTGDVLCRDPYEYDVYDEWRFLPKVKTELTLAEVEEKLGLEKDSLIIK